MKLFSFGKKKKSPQKYSIVDVTDKTFETQVIKRSYKQPVMVDFWAAWCVPCRQLGPVLEQMAEEESGDWMLAKLNTEHNQRMAGKYQIRSIPAVKMFRNGRIVGEFTGVLPAPHIRQFIDQSLAQPAPIQGLRISDDPAKRLTQAEHHLKKGKAVQAYALLTDFPQSPEADKVQTLFPLAKFICDIEDGDGVTGIDELDAQYQKAAKALSRSKPAAALDALIAALDVGEDIDRKYTTEVIDSIFALLGENHKITQKYKVEMGK